MSRVLPILFNTDMVRAILDGRKTVTRRLVKERTIIRKDQEITKNLRGQFELYNVTPRCGIPQNIFFKPPYQLGDILYVRETWGTYSENWFDADYFLYRADYPDGAKKYMHDDGIHECDLPKWHPSLHTPKEAARLWLKVTRVSVERLQDMSTNDAMKEGIHYCECPDGFTWKSETDMHNCYTRASGAMKALWDSSIKKSDLDLYGWDANPWVWIIEFEWCEKPEGV